MRVHARAAVHLTREAADDMGHLNRTGERLIWEGVGGAPAGARVLIDVGPVRYPTPHIIGQLVAELGPDAELCIEGPASNVERWLELVEQYATPVAPPHRIGRAA